MTNVSKLKEARLKCGLSLRAAAAKLRIHPSTLSRYESGMIRMLPAGLREAMQELYRTDLSLSSFRRKELYRRLSAYEESRQLMAADLLIRQFERLDRRGKRTVLNLLRFESRFGSETYPPEGKL